MLFKNVGEKSGFVAKVTFCYFCIPGKTFLIVTQSVQNVISGLLRSDKIDKRQRFYKA